MTTAAIHLRTIATRWTDLNDALAGTRNAQWPPAGNSDLFRALTERDDDEAAELRALERSPDQIGAVAAPIDLHILDTMRVVQAALVQVADETAAVIQQSPITPARARYADYLTERARKIAEDDRNRRNALAKADAADPRRWKYSGGRRRTAVYAALWLLGRVERQPGPFWALGEQQLHRIGTVAAGACERVEQALDIASRREQLAEPCGQCGGRIDIHGGAGASPLAHCTGCGHIWTEQGIVASELEVA